MRKSEIEREREISREHENHMKRKGKSKTRVRGTINKSDKRVYARNCPPVFVAIAGFSFSEPCPQSGGHFTSVPSLLQGDRCQTPSALSAAPAPRGNGTPGSCTCSCPHAFWGETVSGDGRFGVPLFRGCSILQRVLVWLVAIVWGALSVESPRTSAIPLNYPSCKHQPTYGSRQLSFMDVEVK